ncbi:hypothetical protein LR48_Vigan02g075600 [Vigna angularis]|uniref:Uncharacterized protein n=1 Tax=Phaseolus angularis TaxID=3914 RepID=A0A0L9TVV2_PHAAN|nr:hypothetical protein LR48_Vigan02g075600 [Vigna angularis]
MKFPPLLDGREERRGYDNLYLDEMQADRNLIWQDLLMTFDMPNVESLRNRCLSAIVERFRGFKTKLTSRYIFGLKSNETPCSKYSAIDEETWLQFVEIRSSDTWQDSLVEQSSQGQFTQEGRQDILATAIGRPKHPGWVRVFLASIFIRKDEGGHKKEMTQEITKKVRAELYDEVAEMVACQFQQRYEDYGNRPLPSPVAEHVVPLQVEAVKEVAQLPQIGQEGSPIPKKTHLSEDDPLEAQIPLYLHRQVVRELTSGREEINITLIQLWMMYMFDVSNKKGFNDVYGFIDPSMTHERNKFDDIQTYITTYFGMGKEIYFLPYILSSLATHMMLSGRSTTTAKKFAWDALKDCSNSREVASTREEKTC